MKAVENEVVSTAFIWFEYLLILKRLFPFRPF